MKLARLRNISKIVSANPQINFDRYSTQALDMPRYFSPFGELDSGILWLHAVPQFFELRWSKFAQRSVRTFCIVFDAILFAQYAWFRDGGKERSVKKLVAESEVEAHSKSILPWAAGRDMEGLDHSTWEVNKMGEAYLEILEVGYYEATIAFDGLADENVWKRPAEGLLSVGELAGHIVYWEAMRFAGEGTNGTAQPNPAKCRISSPLVDQIFEYYPANIATRPSERQLAMTAVEVCAEFLRVHEESIAYFKSLYADLETDAPGYPQGYNYREFLTYAAFHVAYHAGQMYSIRHLLGDTTTDN